LNAQLTYAILPPGPTAGFAGSLADGALILGRICSWSVFVQALRMAASSLVDMFGRRPWRGAQIIDDFAIFFAARTHEQPIHPI
jgi:hypothetical protein